MTHNNPFFRKKLLCPFLILLLLIFSACSSLPEEAPTESKPIITISSLYRRMTLGDAIYESNIIAFGEVTYIGETTIPPYIDQTESNLPPLAYKRQITVRVKEGLKNCKEGDDVYFWQPGGEAPNGFVYVYEGVEEPKIGDSILVFIDNRGDVDTLATQIVNKDKKLLITKNYMQEMRGKTTKELGGIEISMKEYLQKVKKVVQEQAKEAE